MQKSSNASPIISLIGILLVLLGIASFMGTSAEATESAPKQTPRKSALASAWVCPSMTAVWLDESTVQCLKEAP